MNKVKWGILGTGQIANIFCTALKTIENAEIYAVGSRNINKAKAFGKKFGIKKCYGSFESLMEDSNIDIIYVALPHSVHKEYVVKCLHNNKNVLCEKPMGVNKSEVNEMVELAQKNNLFLIEGMWTSFLPVTREIMASIKSGEIGKIKLVRSEFGFPAPVDKNSRFRNPNLAGGALLDIGIYTIAYSSMIYNKEPINMVSCVDIGETGVDNSASGILDYGDGKRAEISMSFDALLPTEATIVGEKGFIKVEKFFGSEKATIYKDYGQNQRVIEIPHKCNGYEYQAQAVTDCIINKQKESEFFTLNRSKSLIKIMDELRKSWGVFYPNDKI